MSQFTPWKTNVDPENHWLVEENNLPGVIARVYMLVFFGSVTMDSGLDSLLSIGGIVLSCSLS